MLNAAITLCNDIGSHNSAPVVALTRSSSVVRDGLLKVVDLHNIVCGVMLCSEDAGLLAVCDRPQLLAALCGNSIQIWEMGLAQPDPATVALPDDQPLPAVIAVNSDHIVCGGSYLAFCRWRDGGIWRILTTNAASKVHSLSFDSTRPSVLWVGSGHGPFAIDLDNCCPPILVPMVLSEDAPWHSEDNEEIARKALKIPPDIAATTIAPKQGAAALAIAGGNGVSVTATNDSVYISCAATQTTKRLDLAGVCYVAAMVNVVVVHERALKIYDRSGVLKAELSMNADCKALVATEAGARVATNDRAITVIVKK